MGPTVAIEITPIEKWLELGQVMNSVGVEFAADFMFWPAPGHDRSLGISAGLLIAIQKRH